MQLYFCNNMQLVTKTKQIGHNVCILFIFVTFQNYHLVATEDCALGAKKNKNSDQPMVVNGRRQATDVIGPVIKYKFGITYPYGVRPYSGFTTNPLASYATPPTNFFPLGSSTVAINQMPIPRMYGHPYSLARPCDLWIRPCMRAYETGYVCGVALHGAKYTFTTYCAMEFANCKLKLSLWQVAYFGYCVVERMPDMGEDFDIEGDNFLEAAVINEPPFNPLTGQQETLF